MVVFLQNLLCVRDVTPVGDKRTNSRLYTAVVTTHVRPLPGVDPAVPGQTRGLVYIISGRSSTIMELGRTSENRFPHPPYWQACGFSPVCVRM